MKTTAAPLGLADITNEAHHAHPAIGSSGLVLMQRSPLHYWSRYLDPEREHKESTPAQKIGTAWHTAIFEPAKMRQRYVEIPEGLDRRTKEGKALWAEIEATGLEPIKAADIAEIFAMADAALAHPTTRVILDRCGQSIEVERSMFWVDPDTGAHCKIRPDLAVMPCKMFPNGLIVDGKTTGDASPEEFARSAWNYDMAIQAAWYSDGFQRVVGTKEPPPFLWLAQEKERPYATAYYSAGDDIIKFGRKRYLRLLRLYAECCRTGVWPGYPPTVEPLQLPSWAAKIVQDEIGEAA